MVIISQTNKIPVYGPRKYQTSNEMRTNGIVIDFRCVSKGSVKLRAKINIEINGSGPEGASKLQCGIKVPHQLPSEVRVDLIYKNA